MHKVQYETLETLQGMMRDDANAIFQRYRTLRRQYFGPKELESGYSRDYCFRPTNFDHDMPTLPERDPWDDPLPSTYRWDTMLEHCQLCFYTLDREFEHVYRLPFRWLFDPNWETEAVALLDAEAQRFKLDEAQRAENQRKLELAQWEQLQKKYGKS